ncbi:MAG TPA: polyphenol oxidase family protein, partial [Gemmatimonas sp.]|nr:polyphenol oxidase family protein [Gemmatimonas sp.]
AFTTGRLAGTFGLGSDEPSGAVTWRWDVLQESLERAGILRLCSAAQVHGATVVRHEDTWRGWLRVRGVDGHFTASRGTALAVTVADCTPVFIAHPAGAIAALHAGWRGTAAGILGVGMSMFERAGFPADECTVHLGPSICGRCYEVGPEVLTAVFGSPETAKALLDVHDVLANQAARFRVSSLTKSEFCTRCDNAHFFSHRAGDTGRQLGVIALQ